MGWRGCLIRTKDIPPTTQELIRVRSSVPGPRMETIYILIIILYSCKNSNKHVCACLCTHVYKGMHVCICLYVHPSLYISGSGFRGFRSISWGLLCIRCFPLLTWPAGWHLSCHLVGCFSRTFCPLISLSPQHGERVLTQFCPPFLSLPCPPHCEQ